VEFGLLYNYVKKEIERKHTFMHLLPHSKKEEEKEQFICYFLLGRVSVWSNIGALNFEVKIGRMKLKAHSIVPLPKKIGSADPSSEITLREWNLGGEKNKDNKVMDFI